MDDYFVSFRPRLSVSRSSLISSSSCFIISHTSSRLKLALAGRFKHSMRYIIYHPFTIYPSIIKIIHKTAFWTISPQELAHAACQPQAFAQKEQKTQTTTSFALFRTRIISSTCRSIYRIQVNTQTPTPPPPHRV